MASASRAFASLTRSGAPERSLPPADSPIVRVASVDQLRGVVMILMALDHTRDFFSGPSFPPENLAHTSGLVFLTRWVTHFCAPVFFLLAGMGAGLAVKSGKPVAQVSRFLWTRGLWLILLEGTIVGYGWTFVFPFMHGGVIWSLGSCMVAMALIVRLPIGWVGGLGALMILTHNLFDHLSPAAFGSFSWIWILLHWPGAIPVAPLHTQFLVVFPIIPWLGVMAVGYALAVVMQRQDRRKLLLVTGAALTLAFLVLRTFHLYGNSMRDVHPTVADSAGAWSMQSSLVLTVVSYFNTLKYPASLQFLLMTLGPALMALAWFDGFKTKRGLAGILLVFGRVPLFYYMLHLLFLHTLAVWVALAVHQPAAWLLYGGFMFNPIPPAYGHSLAFIYAIWMATVALLYFPCKWFMNLKREHPGSRWLNYL